MRVAMIGTGYVGLVSGACFADFGHDVICIDKDPGKIARLNGGGIPIFEPDLDVLVAQNVKAARLSFTVDAAETVKNADAVFIAVGTPSRRGDGHADLSYVYAAAEEIAGLIEGFTVIVTKSTVPVGTGDEIEKIIKAKRPDAQFAVVSNPEFLREGAAIEDFKHPDRVVVGLEDERARPVMADLCEAVGADVQQVAKGIGLDKRIGGKFLNAGPGYGGSCFPKDTLALVKTAQDYGAPTRLIETTVQVNDARKKAMAGKVAASLNNELAGKTVGVLGLTFKPNTDDMRDAPALDIIPALQALGASVQAFDAEGACEAAHMLAVVNFKAGAYDVAEGADALVIITEWDQFRALDLSLLKFLMKSPIVVDLRNVYMPAEMVRRGFTYASIGRV